MKLIYYQPYTKKRATKCWYGTPPKGIFKNDVIKLQEPDGEQIWVTPDEAADMIRALSAGLHHALVKHPELKGVAFSKVKKH